jgi:phosphoribosylanthranilate isomerase
VKVCGITRAEDALLAAELGASAVGLVFWPKSPRRVSPEIARAIVAVLPASVVCVGVFVDQPIDDVRRTSQFARLGAIQLHGSEPVEYAQALLEPVIKAVPVHDGFEAEALDRLPATITVLLDAHDPERHGGTGKTVNWEAASQAARRRPIVLAGGLTPWNVAHAVAVVHPYAVDVSSGVEREPGIKDAQKLRAFFRALGQ